MTAYYSRDQKLRFKKVLSTLKLTIISDFSLKTLAGLYSLAISWFLVTFEIFCCLIEPADLARSY